MKRIVLAAMMLAVITWMLMGFWLWDSNWLSGIASWGHAERIFFSFWAITCALISASVSD